MSTRLGVDLGTTWTAAAISTDGSTEALTLGNRTVAIPSVVAIDGDRTLVGEAAERHLLTAPADGAREFKRRLGDETPYLLGGAPYGAEALMGRLLADVVGTATERLGAAPDEVVLTHPATWGAYKTDLLHEAGRVAGLDRVTLLGEPQAAALHYVRLGRVAAGDVVAVYDFGGGTFDVAVVRCGDVPELLGTPEGLERLGGIDLDQAVLATVNAAVDGKLGELDAADPEVARGLARLRAACTDAKEVLSADTDAVIDVQVPGLATQVRVTRGELEGALRPRLDDTVAAVERAIASAGLTAAELAGVLLVGGSSRIPLVAEQVAARLGRPVLLDADPKLVVALGAAGGAASAALVGAGVAAAAADGSGDGEVEQRSAGAVTVIAPAPGAGAGAKQGERGAAATAAAVGGVVAAGAAAAAGGMALTGTGLFADDEASKGGLDAFDDGPVGFVGDGDDGGLGGGGLSAADVQDALGDLQARAGLDAFDDAGAAGLGAVPSAPPVGGGGGGGGGGVGGGGGGGGARRPAPRRDVDDDGPAVRRPVAPQPPPAASTPPAAPATPGDPGVEAARAELRTRLEALAAPEGADAAEFAELQQDLDGLLDRFQPLPGQSVDDAIAGLKAQFEDRVHDFAQDQRIEALIEDQRAEDAAAEALTTRVDAMKAELQTRLEAFQPPAGADPAEVEAMRARLAAMLERFTPVPGQTPEEAMADLRERFNGEVSDFAQDLRIDALVEDEQAEDAAVAATTTTAPDGTTTATAADGTVTTTAPDGTVTTTAPDGTTTSTATPPADGTATPAADGTTPPADGTTDEPTNTGVVPPHLSGQAAATPEATAAETATPAPLPADATVKPARPGMVDEFEVQMAEAGDGPPPGFEGRPAPGATPAPAAAEPAAAATAPAEAATAATDDLVGDDVTGATGVMTAPAPPSDPRITTTAEDLAPPAAAAEATSAPAATAPADPFDDVTGAATVTAAVEPGATPVEEVPAAAETADDAGGSVPEPALEVDDAPVTPPMGEPDPVAVPAAEPTTDFAPDHDGVDAPDAGPADDDLELL
jgi:actin-like ATPase involved in cell morphogenesis